MQDHSKQPTKPTSRLARRSILGIVAFAAVGLTLAACSAGSSAATPGSPVAATIQLNYLKNVQFAGSLVALDKGLYTKNGINATLTAGGPNLSVEPVVQSGKALIGITHTATAVNAINNGADLSIIGAGYQKNPFCIVSLAGKPINTPKELIGKKIGVSATNLPIWNAFLKANNISSSQVTTVTIDFDPTPLVSGEVDGFVGFYTNEPIILQQQGIKTSTMLLNDFGYPLLEEVYITKTSNLKDPTKLKEIVDVMKAESEGWTQAIADPSMSADLATNKYGKDLKLNLQQQVLAATAQNGLVTSATTKANGLFWMSNSDIAATVKSLSLGGSKATASMFTDSVLKDVYAK
jgi:ABC-type nitrate/sulfonate/bicarbonate transport system substrate-binding protein